MKDKPYNAVDAAYRHQVKGTRAGVSRIRARGKKAIQQVRAVYRQAGEPVPEGLHLPSPKRKRGRFKTN